MNQRTASLAMACTGGVMFFIILPGGMDATQLLRFIALLLALSTFWRGFISYMDRCPNAHGGHEDHTHRTPVAGRNH